MERKFLDQRKWWLLLGAFIAVSILFFFDTLHTPFFSDDFHVLDRLSKGDFDAGVFFRPLSDLSLYIDWKLFDNNPFWFHLHNVILHGVTSFAVVLVVYQIQRYWALNNQYSFEIAILSGFLFLIYPFHAETVIWVVGRGVILSTLWVCFSLIIFCRYGKTKTGYFISVLCFFISLFGYETAAVLPLLIFLLVLIRYRRVSRALVVSSAYFGFVIIFLFARHLVVGNIAGYYRIGAEFSRYVYNLCALLTRSVIPPFFDSRFFFVVGASIFLLFIFVLYRLRKLQPVIFANTSYIISLFLLTLLPVVTVGIDTHDYEGGRFLYQPSVFFCFLFSFILINIKLNTRIKGAVILFVCCGYFYFLYDLKNSWKIAGQFISEILRSDIKFSKENYFMLIPDNNKGAYIFRNGLQEAFRMNKLMPDSASVKVLSFSEIVNGVVFDSVIFRDSKILIGKGWQLDTINRALRNDEFPRKDIDLNNLSLSVFVFSNKGFIRLYPFPVVKPG